MNESSTNPASIYDGWQKLVRSYQQPDAKKGVWQIINSFGGFLVGWIMMYLSLDVGYWLTLLLAIPTAGFVIRIFIIQHDCGHNSFFASRKANNWVGAISGIVTFTPYNSWRKQHAIHHKTHAELEERGIGDVWTLTVDEYNEAPRSKQILYRVFRNPIILFGICAPFCFLILYRFARKIDRVSNNGELISIRLTNLVLFVLFGGLMLWLGLTNVLLVQLPITIIASSVGFWMFYVQHQFEHTYWEHTPEWSYTLAAMEGSSYYKLPKVLQWFTGNIGFHHIHHLSPRIPNYNLEACHNENPMFQQVVQLTLWESFKTASLALWDEKQRQLITFRDAKRLLTAV